MRSRPLSVFIMIMLCLGCVEPYSPVINLEQINALVVDGFIDNEGTAVVKLSRSLPLQSFAQAPIVTGATISIKSSTGEEYSLDETTPSTYTASNLEVDTKSTYILKIHLPDGKEYLSDEVKIHPTPPVGKIYYTFTSSGEEVEIRTDSRDVNPEGTGYYLWDGLETYEYRSVLFSRFKRVNGIPVARKKNEFVDTCWREVPLPVVVGSTARLSENLIKGQLLTRLPKFDPKISKRYRILVRQRAISEQEFNYRTQLKKTSDMQATLFAEIPGRVVSNVRSTTDPGDFVLGYFRGQQIQQQFLYIDRTELPEAFQVDPEPPIECGIEAACPTNTPSNGPNVCIEIQLLSESKIVITSFEYRNSTVYTFAPAECGDCRLHGGKTTPPPYWY